MATETVGATSFTGLALPVGVTSAGRARLSTGDEQLEKIIGLHLSFSDSENPFQDIGIDQVIFNVNDQRLQPLIRFRLQALFDRLKADERAELDEGSVIFVTDEQEGEMELKFKYVNLRTNRPESFRGRVDLIAGRVVPL